MGKIVGEIKKFKILIVLLVLLFVYWNCLKITQIEYYSEDIPASFEGYRIVQITDLHCEVFGREQKYLITAIKKQEPDLIVLIGDMYDKKQWNYDSIKDLISGISGIAPIYAVTGNNEYDDSNMFEMLKEIYDEYGVQLLDDEKVIIEKDEEHICLYGLYYRYYIKEQYFDMTGERNQFNILLYHDPNQFPKLKKNGFDLVLAGHTHGGIIRIPFIGGVIDNSYQMFPKYDYGMFCAEECDMYVSSGLGTTGIPRINNRPEIVTFILKTDKKHISD